MVEGILYFLPAFVDLLSGTSVCGPAGATLPGTMFVGHLLSLGHAVAVAVFTYILRMRCYSAVSLSVRSSRGSVVAYRRAGYTSSTPGSDDVTTTLMLFFIGS